MTKPQAENLSLKSIMTPARVPEELAGHVRARQIASVENLVVVIALANVISVWAVLQSFWGDSVRSLLTIWAVLVAVMSCLVGGIYYFSPKRTTNESPSENGLVKVEKAALAMGVVWGLTPMMVIPSAEPMGQMALGIILVGLMFSGAFLLGRLPRAAFSFVLPIAAFFVLSLQFNYDPRNGYLSVLTIVYLCVLAITIRWTHHQFLRQIISGVEIENQSELIGLLLRDFEESTSDWLWQTDVDGNLIDVPMSMGADKAEYKLMRRGQSLVQLFEATSALHVLKSSVERERDFRDLTLRLSAAGNETWWSITGKPVYERDKFIGYRGVASDVTQSKKTEDRIAYMAHYDDLTGLPNRASLHEGLEKTVRAPAKPGYSRAVIWLDLDKFKWVNDTLGHSAGDELLRTLAARLLEITEPKDIVARLGGDEFVIVIERNNPRRSIESFLDLITEHLGKPYDISGSTVTCSASLGVRMIDEADNSASELLKHADLALYHAKEKGRGCWQTFEQCMEDEAKERQKIERDLRRAIRENELCLYFQPLVDAHTHELSACETLLRWNHPERGLIFPGEFIEYAEDCGLITEVGEWVIAAARRQLFPAQSLPGYLRAKNSLHTPLRQSENCCPL